MLYTELQTIEINNIKNVVLLSLYATLLKYKIVEILYPSATVAGLDYSTYPAEKGLILKVSGYSQNLHHLVEAYIQNLTIFAGEVTEQEFDMFLEQTLKNYDNTLTNPKSFAKSLRLCVIDNEFYPTYEKYEALKKLTLKDFHDFGARFLQKMKIQGLFQGNLTHEAATNVMKNLLSHLEPEPIEKSSMMDLRARKQLYKENRREYEKRVKACVEQSFID